MDALLHATGLPGLIVPLILTGLFSFVMGLAYHGYRRLGNAGLGFGTTRTFTLIGVLGFLLMQLGPSLQLYALGLSALVLFLGIYYWHRTAQGHPSILGPLLAVLTYLIGPLAVRFPIWLLVAVVVAVLLLLEAQPRIRSFSDKLPTEELVTLAKFLIMVGIILPLLPDRRIAPFLSITYYQLWVAVLAVSGLSYLSYLTQAYLFKKRGTLLTGLLGGLYSSTAATIVLARQSRDNPASSDFAPALILATAMMYARLWVLVLALGHVDVARRLFWPFAAFIVFASVSAWFVSKITGAAPGPDPRPTAPRHPLQFDAALIFAVLFVAFAGVTHLVLLRFGTVGLHVLSFLTGVTDIDPFILSLLAGKFSLSVAQVVGAVLIASGSNNLLKAGYAIALARNRVVLPAVVLLSLLCAVSVLLAYLGGM